MGLILRGPETGQQPRELSREGGIFPPSLSSDPAPGNTTAAGFGQRDGPARRPHPKTPATEPITAQVLYYRQVLPYHPGLSRLHAVPKI